MKCMKPPLKALLMVPLVAAFSGLFSTAVRAASGLERPLRLPSVVHGARCPVSPGALASALGHGFPHYSVAGTAPAYISSLSGPPALIRVDPMYRDSSGWVGQKAPWIISPSYRGPVLIRGARIDAAGGLRFARTTGQHLKALRISAHRGVQPNGWRVMPSLTLVRQPGCYAYQIDGATFSRVIVVRVVLTR